MTAWYNRKCEEYSQDLSGKQKKNIDQEEGTVLLTSAFFFPPNSSPEKFLGNIAQIHT